MNRESIRRTRPSCTYGARAGMACVPCAGNGPPQSNVPEKLAPSGATLPSIVRLEQKDSAWPLAVNVPAAASIGPARVTAPMSVQERVMDRAEPDCG